MEPLFSLGKIVATPMARDLLNMEKIILLLQKHSVGDWGTICKEDKEANKTALKYNLRLMSVYPICSTNSYGEGSQDIWIITEADRSVTTLLLPEEY